MALVTPLASTAKWDIIPDFDHLSLLVRMRAHTGELFILDIRCDNYKETPPFFEFIDPDTGERGTRHAYPKTSDSFFHEGGLCICAPFSRKAYKSVVQTGPHADWSFADWQTSTVSNIRWSDYSKLGDMLGLIQTRLSRPALYKGRMG